MSCGEQVCKARRRLLQQPHKRKKERVIENRTTHGIDIWIQQMTAVPWRLYQVFQWPFRPFDHDFILVFAVGQKMLDPINMATPAKQMAVLRTCLVADGDTVEMRRLPIRF